MGVTSARKLLVGSRLLLSNLIKMNKFVAYSCLAAAVTYGAPQPEADAHLGYGLGLAAPLAHPAPVAVAPATITKKIVTPKCVLAFEEIETQNCVPKVDKVCDTEDVEQQSITFEKECKEVPSKVCGPAAAVHPYGIIKREADAEAEAWHGAGVLGAGVLGHGAGVLGAPAIAAAAPAIGAGVLGYGAGVLGAPAIAAAPAAIHAAPAVALAPAAVATSHVSIKSDCREITKEVCTNTPKTVSKTVPITSCHLKQSVACEKVVKKIPKQESRTSRLRLLSLLLPLLCTLLQWPHLYTPLLLSTPPLLLPLSTLLQLLPSLVPDTLGKQWQPPGKS